MYAGYIFKIFYGSLRSYWVSRGSWNALKSTEWKTWKAGTNPIERRRKCKGCQYRYGTPNQCQDSVSKNENKLLNLFICFQSRSMCLSLRILHARSLILFVALQRCRIRWMLCTWQLNVWYYDFESIWTINLLESHKHHDRQLSTTRSQSVVTLSFFYCWQITVDVFFWLEESWYCISNADCHFKNIWKNKCYYLYHECKCNPSGRNVFRDKSHKC
jgi:hypothetical protein